MLKHLKATENTLKARTIFVKREKSCLGTKRMFENIKEHNYKKMRSSRQNDKSEQWVMHRDVKDDFLGSILGNNK